MSNDKNRDNRILAEFEGWTEISAKVFCISSDKPYKWLHQFKYHTDRSELHRVWEKFRELRFGDNAVLEIQFLTHYRQCIRAMSTGTLTDLYIALVNAVKWYNEVKK